LPALFRAKSLDGFDPGASPAAERALAATRQAVAGQTDLVLIGRPGAGKTHLLAGGALAWAASGAFPPTAEWANVPELIAALRADMRTQDGDGAAWFHDLVGEGGLVVLDDLGREKITDFATETIYRSSTGATRRPGEPGCPRTSPSRSSSTTATDPS
jgi:DNA replication protein DnaC